MLHNQDLRFEKHEEFIFQYWVHLFAEGMVIFRTHKGLYHDSPIDFHLTDIITYIEYTYSIILPSESYGLSGMKVTPDPAWLYCRDAFYFETYLNMKFFQVTC